jgi:hypothetical protein
MKALKWFKVLTLSVTLTFALSGCKKEDDDDDTSAASDNALADQAFTDVSSIADEAANGSVESFKTLSHCATVTHDSASAGDPDTLTIDFGSVNCTGHDGRMRRGKIVVTYTGRYRDAGSTHTITFDNYFVNDNQVLGTKTVTNEGLNTAGHTYFTIVEDGSIILADGGGTITRVSNRSREWIEGESTLVLSDDVYLITGSATGVSAQGTNVVATITDALRVELDCRWITAGKAEVTPSGRLPRIVDFGAGTCDNQATVTIGTRTFDITLR